MLIRVHQKTFLDFDITSLRFPYVFSCWTMWHVSFSRKMSFFICPNYFKIWKCAGGQKIKMCKSQQMGPIICKMMRGFQIWPHNSNTITFDPFFGQKTAKFSKIFLFWRFLGQKGGQMLLSVLSSAARFGIFSSFCIW